MIRIMVVCSLLCCVLPAARADLEVAPEAARLREKVLMWSASLRSFKGTYIISRTWPGVPGAAGKPPVEKEIIYRFNEKNRFLHRTDSLENGTVEVTLTYGLLNGEYVHLNDYHYVDGSKEDYALATLGLDFWQDFGGGAYIYPETIFNGNCSMPLEKFMASGRTSLHDVEGQMVLVHQRTMDRDCIRIWLNSDERVDTFELGVGIDPAMGDVSSVWDGDIFDALKKYTELNLSDYVEINGVWFPTTVRKVWWHYDQKEIMDKLSEDLKHKLIVEKQDGDHATLEFQAETIRQIGPPMERTIQYFNIEPSEFEVNIDIPDSEFEVTIPPGAYYGNPLKETEIKIYPGPWYYRLMKPLPLGLIAAGILVTVVLGGLLYRRLA
jgi:hypothetical protein